MSKRILLSCFFLHLFIQSPLLSESLKLRVHAEAALLMNANTGAILYEKHAQKIMYPASVTKIGTLLFALKLKENQLDEWVDIDPEALATTTEEAKIRSNYTTPAYWDVPEGTKMGLMKGERISLRDLLFGTMLMSGNDGANALAIHIAGSVPNFMAEMNTYLKKIGCKHTHFLNPHGLFHPKHHTTAYDLALMTKEAIKNPTFCEIVGTVHFKRPKTNKQEAMTFVQSNKLLRNGKFYYPKAFGVKTGYIAKAGNTFVAAARQDDRTLIAVLLKAKERNEMFSDAIKMFEAAFNEQKVHRTLLKKGAQTFSLQLEGAQAPIHTLIKEDAVLSYYPSEETKIKCLLYWEELTPPVKKEQQVGMLKIQTPNGLVLLTVPLYAQDTVKGTWFYGIKHFFSNLWIFHPFLLLFGIIVLVFLGIFLFVRRG